MIFFEKQLKELQKKYIDRLIMILLRVKEVNNIIKILKKIYEYENSRKNNNPLISDN